MRRRRRTDAVGKNRAEQVVGSAVRAALEHLEPRVLLVASPAANVFAQFEGIVPPGGSPTQTAIRLAASDFNLLASPVLLGFHVKAASGSALDPAAVQVRNRLGHAVARIFTESDLAGRTESSAGVRLGLGNFSVTVARERGSSGAYELDVYLVGDVNGDRKVDLTDLARISRALNTQAGQQRYVIEADADLNGKINALDLAYAATNLGDTTNIDPLGLTVGPLPTPSISQPDGSYLTNVPTTSLTGQTNGGATVKLDTDGDGFDDRTQVASPNGSFSFASIALHEGLNTLRVNASDSFGQVRTGSVRIVLDTSPPPAPAFDIDPLFDTPPIGDGQTDEAVVTLRGQTQPGAAVRLLQTGAVGVSGADGTFQFSGVALSEGDNEFTVQATELAGNSSEFTRTITRIVSTGPVISSALKSDTGSRSDDGITKDATIDGTVSNTSPITSFLAGFGATPTFNVLADLSDGSFILSPARLAQINGGTLPDGTHTLKLQATDQAGGTSSLFSLTFTLRTALPAPPEFALSPASQTAFGDHKTTLSTVDLVGDTDPGLVVDLSNGSSTTAAATDGAFSFSNVGLSGGANSFTASVTDIAGNTSQSNQIIFKVAASLSATSNQVAIDWNAALLAAITLDASPPPIASRSLAMVSAAMYDAVNAINGASSSLYVKIAAPSGSNDIAAVAQAARDVLVYLYPAQQTAFDARLATTLAAVANGAAKANGIFVGQQVAAAIVAQRKNDGATDYTEYTPGTGDGVWQPTYPMYAPAMLPNWAALKPFIMTSPAQFRPAAGPTPLDSAQWIADYNQVRSLGSATSTTRTADQTQIARFWADGAGTVTPAGHWNMIATQLLQAQGNVSLFDTTRLLAQLNVAMGDAAVVAWDAKYETNFWRPITAIRTGGGNPGLTGDANWTPLINTPNFPEYISGHSTFSAAAAEILASYFGSTFAFSTTSPSPGVAGVTRSYASFDAAAMEAALSRIYGGIHYLTSDLDGLAAGKALGQYVLQRFSDLSDSTAPAISYDSPPATATKTNFSIEGLVTDNLSGVSQLLGQFDSGTTFNVTFDASGKFSVATPFALNGSADGSHVLHLIATDFAGNTTAKVDHAFTLDTNVPTLALTAPAGTEPIPLAAGDAIAGSASGTGSSSVSLCYAFDGDTKVPILFNTTDGSFDQTLDLSKLSNGAHTLSVTATDAAGNVTTSTLNVILPNMIPLTLSDFTPASGANHVGATYRPKITFSRPIDAATLTSAGFFAKDSTGATLPARIVPSNDGTYAWLFFNNALPGGSTITLTVDGSLIRAADNTLLDAAGNGTPGSKLTSTFTTVSTAALPGTSLSGVVADPGPDLKPGTPDDVRSGPDGVLLTADDAYMLPLAGVHVSIAGTNLSTTTDAQGRFTFTSVPSGHVKLIVDGNTATNEPPSFYFPEMVMDLNIQVGRANAVMAAMARTGTSNAQAGAALTTAIGVYLPRLQTSLLETVNNATGKQITVDAVNGVGLTAEQRANLTLNFPANSIIGMNGLPMSSAQIGVSTVDPSLVMEMLPPGLMQHTFDITIQAMGVATFSQPVAMTFPNVFNAEPGTKLNFLSFDHTTGRLAIEGTATVSEDGLSVRTDPNTGITHPGWHGLTPPSTTTQVNDIVNILDFAQSKLDDRPNLPSGVTVNNLSKPGVDVSLIDKRIPDRLARLRDIMREEVGPAYQVTINSGHEADAGHEKGSTHDQKRGIDISMRDSRGNVLSGPVRDKIGARYRAEFPNDTIYHNIPGMDYRPWASNGKNGSQIGGHQTHMHINVPGAYQPPSQLKMSRQSAEISEALDTGSKSFSTANAYYSVTNVRTGAVIFRGKLGMNGILSQLVTPPNSWLVTRFYDPASGLILEQEFATGGSGEILNPITQTDSKFYSRVSAGSFVDEEGNPEIDLAENRGGIGTPYAPGADTDQDLLPDDAEDIIGSNPAKFSTSGDGIGDGAKVQQGLDPLDGVAFPTGIVASQPLEGQANEVVLAGSTTGANGQTAYVATGTHGLAIVDASDFQAPTVVSQLDLPGNATDVAVDSALNLVAVATNAGGLAVVDVSDPSQPAIARTISGTFSHVEVFDGLAYAAIGGALFSYDMLTGEPLQALSLSSGTITGLARDGPTLYTMDTHYELQAIATNGGTMIPRGSLYMEHGGGKVFVGGGVAYVSGGGILIPFGSGFSTVNVIDPDNLTLISDIDAINIAAGTIIANGSGQAVGVATLNGIGDVLHVLDVSDPSNTANFITQFTLPQAPSSVALASGIAFVANGDGGLVVVNYLPFDNKGIAPVVSVDAGNLDVDPSTAGIQVWEGSNVFLKTAISDDVQVRNVELLLNGSVVVSDVSFPFDLSTIAPLISEGSAIAILQVRATDTGGNVTTSDPITLDLVRDTTPPAFVSSDPVSGGDRSQAYPRVSLSFSEALDEVTVTSANFVLTGPGGIVTPSNIQLRANDSQVQVTYGEFPVLGIYQLTVNGSQVTDRAGNAIGADITLGFTVRSENVIYVDANSPASNPDGTSWANAYRDLQQAIGAASAGDTIQIADGTYRPTSSTNRALSFQLKSGLWVLGGYAGFGAIDPDARDADIFQTVLSGDIGAPSVISDNSYHVVVASGVDETARIDGVTITDGNANGAGTNQNSGGGILNIDGSPIINNCVFIQNRSSGDPTPFGGGAIYNSGSGSLPRILNCTFTQNTAVRGGAIFNNGASPTITNCVFTSNMARSTTGVARAGAIYNFGASAAISNCTFSNNTAAGANGQDGAAGAIYNANLGTTTVTACTFSGNGATEGGGAILNNASSPIIADCIFTGNSGEFGGSVYNISCAPTIRGCTFTENSSGFGGAIANETSSPTIDACTFLRNAATGLGDPSGHAFGGAIASNDASVPVISGCTFVGNTARGFAGGLGFGGAIDSYSSTLVLINCMFVGNVASDYGGVVRSVFSSSTLINCTISGNVAEYGGAMYNYESTTTATNCILYGNSTEIYDEFGSSSNVTYSDVAGGFAGDGNIDANPLFIRSPWTGPDGIFGTSDDDLGDLRLRADSPALNIGSNASVPVEVTTDLAGNARVQDGVVDLGAYEGTAAAAAPRVLYVDVNATGVNTGVSWDNAFTNLQSALSTATDGDTIRVADGTYEPTDTADRSIGFALRNGVAIYGGYAGSGSSDPDARDMVTNPTILSGDIGSVGSTEDNSFHVITATAVGGSTVLDGLRLTDGNANGDGTHQNGGGMYVIGSSLTLVDCYFSSNAAVFGGALYTKASTTTLTNCIFDSNVALGVGGGMYDESSHLTLTSCVFNRNTAADQGGGMYNYASTFALTNCIFRGNSAFEGGGMYNYVATSTFTNCTFVANTATLYGGAMRNYYSTSTLINCTFNANTANVDGGALYDFGFNDSLTMRNCVLWNNSAPANAQLYAASAIVGYSDIQGGFSGTGNIGADPLFVRAPDPGVDGVWGTIDDDYGDLRLQEDSPAIDAGDTAALPSGITTDLAGNNRLVDVPGINDPGIIVDMGAYEFQPAVPEALMAEAATILLLPVGKIDLAKSSVARASVGLFSTVQIADAENVEGVWATLRSSAQTWLAFDSGF